MLKHTTLLLLFAAAVSGFECNAELSIEMADPLYADTAAISASADSSVIMRRRLAEMLDTGTPRMTMPVDDSWWLQFSDPVLAMLIDAASKDNGQLLASVNKIRASREQLAAVRSGYYPTVGVSGGYMKSQESGNTMHRSVSPVRESAFSLMADLNWEIDIFGRISAQSTEANAAYNATRAEYVASLTSLSAQVANVYFDLVAARGLLRTAMGHMESQQKILDITKARLEAGLSSKLDMSQATTVLLNTKASIPSLRARIDSDTEMLALLTSVPKNDITAITTRSLLPHCDGAMAGIIPADLIRRRPDVAEAEYNLAAAAAAAGLAKKDWLPTLTLTGSIGVESHALKNIFKSNSLTYSISPTLSWTVFDGMRRTHTVAEAKARAEAAADIYDYTLSSAMQEVSTAKSRYLNLLDEIKILEDAASQCYESLTLSLDLYKSGLADFTNVMDAQVSWLSYENSVIDAQNSALSALMTLYRAMGGGWTGTLPEITNP